MKCKRFFVRCPNHTHNENSVIGCCVAFWCMRYNIVTLCDSLHARAHRNDCMQINFAKCLCIYMHVLRLLLMKRIVTKWNDIKIWLPLKFNSRQNHNGTHKKLLNFTVHDTVYDLLFAILIFKLRMFRFVSRNIIKYIFVSSFQCDILFVVIYFK